MEAGHRRAEVHDGRRPHRSANNRLVTVRTRGGLATGQRPHPTEGVDAVTFADSER